MSFFKNRMGTVTSPLTGQIAAKLYGSPRPRQTGGRVMSAASSMYLETFAQQMNRAADDARKAAYLRAKAGPSTTPGNAERLARVMAL